MVEPEPHKGSDMGNRDPRPPLMSCLRAVADWITCMGDPLPQSSPAERASYTRRLVTMANSPDATVREAAAKNARTPGETLMRLASDPVASVRSWTLRNPAVTREVLETLLDDPIPAIAAFARHRLG